MFRNLPGCPYKCEYSSDLKLGPKADVRVFHVRDFIYNKRPIDNPKALNVYYILESPFVSHFGYGTKVSAVPKDYFNLTVTYRSNADVYFPYDTFVELDGSEKPEDVWTDEQVALILCHPKH
jgi:hypothetical protein